MVQTRGKKTSKEDDKKVPAEDIKAKKITKKASKEDNIPEPAPVKDTKKGGKAKTKAAEKEQAKNSPDKPDAQASDEDNGNTTRKSVRGNKKAAKDTVVDNKHDNSVSDQKPAAKGKRKASKSPAKVDDSKDVKKKVKKDRSLSPAKPSAKDDKPNAKSIGTTDDGSKMVTAVFKGGAAVDPSCPIKDKVHVYMTGQKIYDATLNQSNVKDNNNKYYLIQLLQSDTDATQFYTWNRWGRVGFPGQNMLKPFKNDMHGAMADYEKKFYDKTSKGDYIKLDIAYENEDKDDEETKQKKEEDAVSKSKLPKPTKDLIQLIFDLKMMNRQMKEIGYDAKKMPLGKLSKSNIQKGYEALEKLSKALDDKKSRSVLEDLSSDFYSLIPHDFGFQKMSNFILDAKDKVKTKIDMLQSIQDIQIATKILEDNSGDSDNMIDANYQKLKCELKPLDHHSAEFKMIEEYTRNTHASTHSSFKLEILEIFKTEREGEEERYRKDLHNKMLLWHGSRLTNYVGILSQGLRIAPPEAPVTGYMFGKGVYFADMVSKSANYCFTNKENNTGCLLLCEVALGDVNELYFADYNAGTLPPGKLSTKGVGKTAPAHSSYIKVDGDVHVPIGKGEPTNIKQGSLLYSEYIVYDIKQIKMRYLIKTKFNYTH